MAIVAVIGAFFYLAVNINTVGCTITKPGEIDGTVGGQASFKWNSTTEIAQISWGLCNSGLETVSNTLISVGSIDGVEYNYAYLNSSRYQGRVRYVGDISIGHAWFVIENLKNEDAEPYCVELREGSGASPGPKIYSKVTLKVLAVPTTSPPITPSTTPAKTTPGTSITMTTSTKTTPGSNITTTYTTKSPSSTPAPTSIEPTTKKQTDTGGLKTGEIVGIVIGVLAGLAIIGIIVYFVWKKKKSSHKGVRIPMTD